MFKYQNNITQDFYIKILIFDISNENLNNNIFFIKLCGNFEESFYNMKMIIILLNLYLDFNKYYFILTYIKEI